MTEHNPVHRQIFTHYFTHKGDVTKESPLIVGSILIPAALLVVGFFISGATPSYATILAGAAFVTFIALTILHFALWIIGSIYRDGFLSSVRTAGVFIGASIALIVIGGFLLYGWFIPLALALPFLAQHTPPVLIPFLIVGVIAVALTWYTKGLDYMSNP